MNAINTQEEAWQLLAELYKEGYRTPVELYSFSNNGKAVIAVTFQSANDYDALQLRSKESFSWRLANDPDLLARVRPLKSADTRSFDNEQWPMLVAFFNTLGFPLEDVYTIDTNSNVIDAGMEETYNNIMTSIQNYSVDEWKSEMTVSLEDDAVFFDVKASDKLYLAPEDRIRIW